jgi:hypothetical protein
MPAQPSPREPLTFYRLWCGRRRYSGWKPTWRDAVEAGVPHKVTFLDSKHLCLGPLAWVEVGERKYAHSKTISRGRH